MTSPKGDFCREMHNVTSCSSDQSNSLEKITPKSVLDGENKNKLLLKNTKIKRVDKRSKPYLYFRNEKQQKTLTLQQVITTRQHKIFEQQCEIEELRRRINEVCHENKFLREQNYWQEKALEKLDGKHAELPQLINNHLEEIRIFREQIKRMKEVLKSEKQMRQDTEIAKDRAVNELKHLRKLAEEQNLLEREELMETIEKLRIEAVEREKLLMNLEKYAENLEKNQRFESFRLTKSQREMREACERLVNRVQELEQVIQEKQKIIELSNIYSKRTKHHVPNAQTDTRFDTNELHHSATEHVSRTVSENENIKRTIRERIKEFDLRRQNMERRKVKGRRNHMVEFTVGRPQYSAQLHSENENELQSLKIYNNKHNRPQSAHPGCDENKYFEEVNHSKRLLNLRANIRPRSSYNFVVLPKINHSESSCKLNSLKFGNNSKTSPCNSTDDDDNHRFEILRSRERLARLTAETELQYEIEKMKCNKKCFHQLPEKCSHAELLAQIKTVDRLSKLGCSSISRSKTFDNTVLELKNSSPASDSTLTCLSPHINDGMDELETQMLTNDDNTMKENEMETEFKQETSSLLQSNNPLQNLLQSTETEDQFSSEAVYARNPQVSTFSDEPRTTECAEDIQRNASGFQVCPPSGDHDLDTYLSCGLSPSASETEENAKEEEVMWRDSLAYTRASVGKVSDRSRVYRGPHGLVSNASNDNDCVEVEYITENEHNYLKQPSMNGQPANLPLINCVHNGKQ